MDSNLRNRALGLAMLLTLSAVAAAQFSNGPERQPWDGRGPQPERVAGKIGQWVMAGQTRYRVVSSTSGLRSYKQRFNQSGRTLHPGFASDRLAVIEVEVENLQQRPIEPPLFMAALTDSDGVHGTDWMMDTRQQAFLEESTRDGRRASRIPAQIAGGQTMKLALVFSVSQKATPTAVEFSNENFRDMPFGDLGGPGRMGFGGGGRTTGEAVPPNGFGPRGGARPPRAPMNSFRVMIDLTHGK